MEDNINDYYNNQESEQLEFEKSYKLRDDLYVFFSEVQNLMYVAEKGVMIPYPFPLYHRQLMEEAMSKQISDDEVLANIGDLQEAGIPEVVSMEEPNPYLDKSMRELKIMLEEETTNEDYEECRKSDDEIKRRKL